MVYHLDRYLGQSSARWSCLRSAAGWRSVQGQLCRHTLDIVIAVCRLTITTGCKCNIYMSLLNTRESYLTCGLAFTCGQSPARAKKTRNSKHHTKEISINPLLYNIFSKQLSQGTDCDWASKIIHLFFIFYSTCSAPDAVQSLAS